MADADKTSRVTRPVNDAYTGMLAISLLALLTGCVLLYLDYEQYGDKPAPKITREPSKARPAASADGAGGGDKDKEGGADKDKEKAADKDKEKAADKDAG
jgi:hypothetical protein